MMIANNFSPISFAVFGGMLAAAGLPIYIFAPTFYAENYGVGLTSIAAVLFWLRLVDAIQDPMFGWISENMGHKRWFWVALAVIILIGSMSMLFAVPPQTSPLLWFVVSMTCLFSAFSFLTINFYAQGITSVGDLNDGHMRLAAWRETGALIGICLASVAPGLLMIWSSQPMLLFVLGFGCLGLISLWMMKNQWVAAIERKPSNFLLVWQDRDTRLLLILAFVNALPVAVTSSLFLFFVGHRLQAPSWAGALLMLFFISAAAAAPIWTMAARRFGTRRCLFLAMGLAIVIFALSGFLGAGDLWIFTFVCLVSGAAISADLTLMPAAFAQRLAIIAPNGGQGFGLWSLMNKLTLALAAIILFPLLEFSGFDATANEQAKQSLIMLTILYAICPLFLKLVAILILIKTPLQDD